MSDESKKMRFSLPEGGLVMLEWPDSITVESLEMVEEVIALQLNSVRKAIARRKEAIAKTDNDKFESGINPDSPPAT